MSYASKENALVKTVRCNKMSVGYAHIYYTDYDYVDPKYSEYSVSLEFYLNENFNFKFQIINSIYFHKESINFYSYDYIYSFSFIKYIYYIY